MFLIALKFTTIIIISCFLFALNNEILTCAGEKIRYISTEHPKVTYIDGKHMTFANLTSERYGRSDPFYYVGLHMVTTIWADNSLKVDIYFYEFLTNVYKRGFVEFHFNFCQLIDSNMFGAPMRQGNITGKCPYPPGEYHFYNMSIDIKAIPRGFPFTKGRIYANVTYKNIFIGAGHINMEVKETHLKRWKN